MNNDQLRMHKSDLLSEINRLNSKINKLEKAINNFK